MYIRKRSKMIINYDPIKNKNCKCKCHYKKSFNSRKSLRNTTKKRE